MGTRQAGAGLQRTQHLHGILSIPRVSGTARTGPCNTSPAIASSASEQAPMAARHKSNGLTILNTAAGLTSRLWTPLSWNLSWNCHRKRSTLCMQNVCYAERCRVPLPSQVCMGPGSWVLADWRLYEPLGMKLPDGPACSTPSTMTTQRAWSWYNNNPHPCSLRLSCRRAAQLSIAVCLESPRLHAAELHRCTVCTVQLGWHCVQEGGVTLVTTRTVRLLFCCVAGLAMRSAR